MQQLSLDYVWYDSSDSGSETVASVRGEAVRLFNSAVEEVNKQMGPPALPLRIQEFSSPSGEAGSSLIEEAEEEEEEEEEMEGEALETNKDPRIHCGVGAADSGLCDLVSRLNDEDRYCVRLCQEIPTSTRLSFMKAAAWDVGIGCLCTDDSSLNDNHICTGVIGLDVKSAFKDQLSLPDWSPSF